MDSNEVERVHRLWAQVDKLIETHHDILAKLRVLRISIAVEAELKSHNLKLTDVKSHIYKPATKWGQRGFNHPNPAMRVNDNIIIGVVTNSDERIMFTMEIPKYAKSKDSKLPTEASTVLQRGLPPVGN